MSELTDPKRGEIWRINFNPAKGQEIQYVGLLWLLGLTNWATGACSSLCPSPRAFPRPLVAA
jgi:hypothetical protein